MAIGEAVTAGAMQHVSASMPYRALKLGTVVSKLRELEYCMVPDSRDFPPFSKR
jgi:hypothetical protein